MVAIRLTDRGPAKTVRALALAALCTGVLAGCSGDTSSTLGNLLAFNSTKAPPMPSASAVSASVDCPAVEVQDGAGTVRTFAGSDRSGNSVRYQFGINETARECSVVNGQIAIKVGVSGRLLIGPAGQPGTYSVPVRVAVKRDADASVAASKLYQVTASVQAGEDGASFTVVSDPLLVPFIREEADADYTILVGFDQTGRAAAPAKARRKKH